MEDGLSGGRLRAAMMPRLEELQRRGRATREVRISYLELIRFAQEISCVSYGYIMTGISTLSSCSDDRETTSHPTSSAAQTRHRARNVLRDECLAFEKHTERRRTCRRAPFEARLRSGAHNVKRASDSAQGAGSRAGRRFPGARERGFWRRGRIRHSREPVHWDFGLGYGSYMRKRLYTARYRIWYRTY